jgi:CRISPR-associated protein Cmr6
MNGNAGYLFYKDYYEGVDWYKLENNQSLFEKKSDEIINLGFNKYNFSIENTQYFQLATIYPGLVLGTGYHHETGVIGEFKIGFYFDHTSGLPVIPGSSIKGLLRSAFPNRTSKNLSKDYKDQRDAYIKEILAKMGIENFESKEIDKLELEIFEGIKDESTKKVSEKYLPMYQRDIFHDAFPVTVGDNGLFSDDFITPHKENPLKNPDPLKFLKVAPKVSFQFNFDLKNSDGIFSKEKKLELFLNILLDFGVGAKTNVGYGQFDDSEETRDKVLRDINNLCSEQKELKALASMTDSERQEAEKQKFIKEINNYQGKPSKLFKNWTDNESLKEDPDVARAFSKIATLKVNNKWSRQTKHICKILKINYEQLEQLQSN